MYFQEVGFFACFCFFFTEIKILLGNLTVPDWLTYGSTFHSRPL